MSKEWQKTSVKVKSGSEDGGFHNRSFNNLAEDASADKIVAFAGVLAQLTGEPNVDITLAVSSTVSATEAPEEPEA